MTLEDFKVGQIINIRCSSLPETEALIVDVSQNIVHVMPSDSDIAYRINTRKLQNEIGSYIRVIEDVRFKKGDIIRSHEPTSLIGDFKLVLAEQHKNSTSVLLQFESGSHYVDSNRYELVYRKDLIDRLPKEDIETGDVVMAIADFNDIKAGQIFVVEARLGSSIRINKVLIPDWWQDVSFFKLIKKSKKKENKPSIETELQINSRLDSIDNRIKSLEEKTKKAEYYANKSCDTRSDIHVCFSQEYPKSYFVNRAFKNIKEAKEYYFNDLLCKSIKQIAMRRFLVDRIDWIDLDLFYDIQANVISSAEFKYLRENDKVKLVIQITILEN